MGCVAQSQAEIVTEGVFLCNLVLKEIYDRLSFEKVFYSIYIGHADFFFMRSVPQLDAEISNIFSFGKGVC